MREFKQWLLGEAGVFLVSSSCRPCVALVYSVSFVMPNIVMDVFRRALFIVEQIAHLFGGKYL